MQLLSLAIGRVYNLARKYVTGWQISETGVLGKTLEVMIVFVNQPEKFLGKTGKILSCCEELQNGIGKFLVNF